MQLFIIIIIVVVVNKLSCLVLIGVASLLVLLNSHPSPSYQVARARHSVAACL
jgi:hypothetical protein